MKNILLFLAMVSLSGCVVVGDFPEHRERLHNMQQGNEYCEANPDKCIDTQGVDEDGNSVKIPW